MPDTNPYEFNSEKLSISEEIKLLKKKISNKKKISFRDIIKTAKTKMHIIYIFIGILEMIRNKEIKIEQQESFSDIYIINSIN